ncbi:SoxR reducing system RseC family protein [Marinicellulosiphila megalodicopiae]|uniref:SoxR reducing system RseC family protein n=1 Tax=Marinicellulosiphila megalodicopiae TaxID=2724896 RepID=UPI003BB169A1
MIVENAWVESIIDNQITLQTVRSASCQSCKAKSGCGQALLSKIGDEEQQVKKNNITIFSDETVSIGEEVELILPENSLVLAALIMYLMPLLMMMFFALTASLLNLHDVAVSLIGLIGLAMGFASITLLNNQINTGENFEPKLRRKLIKIA